MKKSVFTLLLLLAVSAQSAILVGDDSSGWGGTTNSGIQSSSGDSIHHEPDTGECYQATASGTAVTAHVLISDWPTATQAKIVVYLASTRAKLAESAVVSSAGGTGERTASISVSITSGLRYCLVLMANGYVDTVNRTGSTFQTSSLALNFATPDDPLPAANVGNTLQFSVWLESADTSGLLLRRRRS